MLSPAAASRRALPRSPPPLYPAIPLPAKSPRRRGLHSSALLRDPNYTSRNASAWHAATESAQSILLPPPSPSTSYDDPLGAIYTEIRGLRRSLMQLMGSSHPSLDTVAKYYFQAEGKHLRPLLILLMSQATNGLAGAAWEEARVDARRRSVDDSLTGKAGILNDWNPDIMGPEPTSGAMSFAAPFRVPPPDPPSGLPPFDSLPSSSGPEILPTQRRLAGIAEMIHVASLLHDDVIDASPLRRGTPSAPNAFGNKMSILSGDFLLGRASVAIARLGSREVHELLATVIANLVEGEVMQLKATTEPETTPTKRGFEEYMRKTYLKTASLMAKSARAAVMLGGCGTGPERQGEWVKDVAYGFGRNLGMAFQLVDDALDYLPSASLGKPSSGADLQLGLATAPLLFAWEQSPSLGPLIARKFSAPGDVEAARKVVVQNNGLGRTVELARKFAGQARELVEMFPESEARGALVELTEKVVDRVK